MTADPQDPISEITEISDTPFPVHLQHFLASVAYATIVGTLGLMLALLVNAPSSQLPPNAFLGNLFAGLMFFSLAAGMLASAGMLVVGLPATLLLSRLRLERTSTYTTIGAITGCAILVVILDLGEPRKLQDFLILFLGGLSGATGAHRWGRFRAQIARRQKRQPPGSTPTNPFHDMIH